MKRIYLILSFAVVCATCVGYFYMTNRPEYLASKSEYIPTFFSLPKEDFTNLGNQFCIDELHSQGRRFEDFGSAHYVLKISDLHPNIREVMIKNPSTIRTVSSLILSIRRADILGTFELKHNSCNATAHYEQIYDD
ncbi:MAG: hypothetical protein K2N05_09185 [Muribaculaceae bacterium]|nr:hypothetical protein [Muribaculaceae bacterium]